jgi:hypothetical protein
MDDIFNTPQNNDSENRNEAPPKANESNAPYNSPISSSAYESYQPKPQQNNSYNGTPYGAPQGAYSQRPEPPRYNQENNQYGNGPQFNPSYSQMGYYPPKSQKKNSSGKKVFAVLICICIVVASIAIGSAFADNDPVKKPASQQNDKTDDTTINGAKPNVEDSPITFDEYSGKGQMTPEQIYDSVKDVNVGVIVYAKNQKVGEGSGIIVGEDETKTYACAEEYTWAKFESADAIPEFYNDKKFIVAFQINETKECQNVMPITETVPPLTYFQKYMPEFSDGYNISAPLLIDKTFIVRDMIFETSHIIFTEERGFYPTAQACVVLDGACYLAEKLGVEFTDGTYDLRGGKYNSVLNQVMITGKYTQTDEKGNTIHYGLFKLDDIVEILLNWEDE